MKKTYTEQQALARAASLCSASEQCISQIREKLVRWEQSPEAAERIIARLLAEKYIDEQRFARAYALDKLRYNRWGKVKIEFSLRQLGIPQAFIAEALSQLPADEYRQTLARLLDQKAPSVKGRTPYERNAKLIRFALGHGFLMDDILQQLPE